MASSRWKRFAFFDRRNLSLPQPVIDDILSPQLFSDSALSSGDRGSGDNLLRRDTGVSQSEGQQQGSISSSGKGDYVSLAVTSGAGIPLASLPPSQDESDHESSNRTGVRGMQGTLSVCANNTGTSSTDRKSNDQSGSKKDEPESSSTNTVFQFSSVGQPMPVIKHPDNRDYEPDGSLVLAFAASQTADKVHCIDLTVRCNPVHQRNLKPSSSGSSTSLEASGANTNQNLFQKGRNSTLGEENRQDEEDLDGWRGYFQPFAHDTQEETIATNAKSPSPGNSGPSSTKGPASATATSNTSSSKFSRIVAIAVCSDSDYQSQKQKNAQRQKNIYVACITDSEASVGVTVHKNPHLYLNDASLLEAASRLKNMKSKLNKIPGSSANSNSNSVLKDTAASENSNISVTPKADVFQPVGRFDYSHRGKPRCVDISYESGVVVVGTDNGMVLVYRFNNYSGSGAISGKTVSSSGAATATSVMAGSNGTKKMYLVMEIPAPPTGRTTTAAASSQSSSSGRKASWGYVASCVKVLSEIVQEGGEGGSSSNKNNKGIPAAQAYNTKIFVTYRRQASVSDSTSTSSTTGTKNDNESARENAPSSVPLASKSVGGGVCCYDVGIVQTSSAANLSPTARYDLDGRDVTSSCLCDIVVKRSLGSAIDERTTDGNSFMVARSDGLYTYSSNEKLSVSPIDGTKIAMCSIPPPSLTRARAIDSGASYFLVAATDSKSGRDAVDIYDATNKLVAFHLLLSPGHKALRAAATTTLCRNLSDGNSRGGLPSSVILTSGGSIVTLVEKVTSEKVSLLVQKNLFSAAISMAFADASYQPSDITSLYKKHAEHLYRKGDFSAAMDQYIYTIGSLEPSYVIFRYLDAPKIPLLVKYLNELRSRDLATPVQNELLRTCYLKLNDVSAAEKISASLSKTLDSSSCISLVSKLLHNPTEALTTVCSLEAPQAAEALTLYGDTLARALPRETAGIVISLCDGAYSPSSLAELADRRKKNRHEILRDQLDSGDDQAQVCETYPVHMFSSAFLENPKLLRVILAHCHKNKRELTDSLKRTLLELTLEEWNSAKRIRNVELESKHRAEAISILTDPYSCDMGDYEALVIVQLANFSEGEVLLYERLQMAPMLIEKYAKDGTYKARRQMLAMCRSDPELLADVLGHFVTMASEKIAQDDNGGSIGGGGVHEGNSVNSDTDVDEILDDIKEALSLARAQGVLPPVRIARILAGDGVGQFSNERSISQQNEGGDGVPLSVALDYVGAILDDSSNDIKKLKSDVHEYSQMCNTMESEIESLLSSSLRSGSMNERKKSSPQAIKIEEMYSTLLQSTSHQNTHERKTEASSEEFWREMGHSEDRFETIARFFAKGIID